MRIVKKLRESKKVTFGELEPGDVFIFDGHIYFKCDVSGAPYRWNATNLEANIFWSIPDESPCIKLKATLLWEEDDE